MIKVKVRVKSTEPGGGLIDLVIPFGICLDLAGSVHH